MRTHPLVPRCWSWAFLPVVMLAALVLGSTACSSAQARANPIGTLAQPRNSPKSQLEAMSHLDSPAPSPTYVQMLKQIVVSNDYLIPTRKAAFQRLAKYDPELLESSLDLVLGRLEPAEYRTWVLEQIAKDQRRGLTKAIIRSWARPVRLWERDEQRAEHLALAAMYGEDQVSTILVQTMLDADPLVEANLRARCWELLVETGHREKLVVLVQDEELVGADALLRDMRAAVTEFDIVPRNREEILWIRELRKPSRRAYWDHVSSALAQLNEKRREDLEPRDLAVVDAAARHRPELLSAENSHLYDDLDRALREDGGRHSADFTGWVIRISESLHDDRDKLTWGDLAAMSLARDALQSEALRAHLFDFAERDLLDKTTEYGGVIRLDSEGRYELIEHPPRTRIADDRFLASQALFEDGYTALFHVHNHAQKYRNVRYAGPHIGDMEYADETGANGLVFTFIDPESMNVDFYRHGAVIVDLGTITRPTSG